MTEAIYHTTNSIPLLGLIISLILISGFYSVGEITIKYFGLKEIIQNITKTKYQNIRKRPVARHTRPASNMDSSDS